MEKLERFEVVLVRPSGAVNVGAACRAMKSCGIHRLVIVGTRPDELNSDQVRKWAIHSTEIYERARFTTTLAEALSGSVFSAGMTRRLGARRKHVSMLPEELADRTARLRGTVSLVFGNERTGLNDDELAECVTAVRIPTDPGCPSLNLSHAVQVIGYVLYRQVAEETAFQPIPRSELDELIAGIRDSLKKIGYFRTTDGSYTARVLRDVFARAGLTEVEADRVRRLFRNVPHVRERAIEEAVSQNRGEEPESRDATL